MNKTVTSTAVFGILAIIVVLFVSCTSGLFNPFGRPNYPKSSIVDCGSEMKNQGITYNPTMRDCFFENFLKCHPAMIYQNTYTIEGDPIMTTAVIKGRENELCKVYLSIDSRDNFGEKSIKTYNCDNVTIDEKPNNKKLLTFAQCIDGQSAQI